MSLTISHAHVLILLLSLLSAFTIANPIPSSDLLIRAEHSVQMCSGPNFSGTCSNIILMQSSDKCYPIPFPWSGVMSIEPGPGVQCVVYDDCNNQGAIRFIFHGQEVGDLKVHTAGAYFWYKCFID